jgi:copper/silver efflux system protein
LSVTLLPMLMVWLIRGRILPEDKNPISRVLVAGYRPMIAWVLRWRWLTVIAAVVVASARSGRRPSSAPSSCRP